MGTRIGQVRIRANTDDALAARMRGEAALRSLDLEPAAMPARMILCIRSMPDPMPGGVDLRSPHAPRPAEWERAARGAVNDALRRAVRPARGIVPIDADAVLFADHAELLACAARDAGNGFLAAWWWPHLLRGTNVESVLFEWGRHPQHIAAAMELLAQSGDVVPFVQQIAPRSATGLLLQVLAAHNLGHVASEVANILATPTLTAAAPAAPLPRQLAIADLVESTLTIEQRLFALVTLAIRRTPSVLRAPETARTLIQTVAQLQTACPRIATNVADVARTQDAPAPRTREGSPASPHIARRSPEDQHPTSPTGARRRETAQTKAAPQATRVDQQPFAQAETPQEAKHQDTREIRTTDTRPEAVKTQKPEARSQSAPTELPETIATNYAGLFFLLNVATALGLYDPYGRETDLELDVWDFLALTGRALVPELVEDDLWPLLAALANRETDEALPELDDELLTRVREALALVIESDDPAAFVINQPGRITVSPAHLDVTFCLAAHPIEIRVAGLDRDPGWIPAAGRHVDFHFD